MLDQSFSLKNFLNIFYSENRKGTLNSYLFSKEYLAKHKEIKELLALKSHYEKELFESTLDNLNDEKFELLETHLTNVSDVVNLKSFQFHLTQFDKDGKTIYTFNKDAASFYASKQLQINISRTFKVKQSNRYEIVKQLKALLDNNFPKYLIRTDIKSFYESIPQERLLQKIDENQLLNFKSKKLIKSLIWHYEDIKDKDLYKPGHGVARGIGISAYLTELYMRDVDLHLSQMEDVIYYARYVDDIVIVFVPPSEVKLKNYLAELKTVVEDYGLDVKDGSDGGENKTFELNFFASVLKYNFDFLGYKFVIENSIFKELRMSDNKLAKYNNRLSKTISEYNIYSKYNERIARKLMFKRLRFLTGNFHLINSKKNIKAGIYYSNILLSDNNSTSLKDITILNNLIKKHVSKICPHSELSVNVDKLKKSIIRKFNFGDGFYGKMTIHGGLATTKRTFSSFTKTDFIEITSCWR
jgi:hypothetical protein